MKIITTNIEGLKIYEPIVFGDERGYFMETFNAKMDLNNVDFIQDNESRSKKGVLRGIHFQTNNPQGKLVRCSQGKIFDVAVDLRPESKTFGQWFGIELSEENKKMFYIPPRFGHGFLVLSEYATFNYKCTSLYDATSDSGIMYNNNEVNIEWPEIDCDLIISDKDQNHKLSIMDIQWH